eukprot:1159851-Pelagomonas_calceolata.AAC.8
MEFNAQLSKGRKKRALPPTLATPDDFAGFSLASSNPLHKTTQNQGRCKQVFCACFEVLCWFATAACASEPACSSCQRRLVHVPSASAMETSSPLNSLSGVHGTVALWQTAPICFCTAWLCRSQLCDCLVEKLGGEFFVFNLTLSRAHFKKGPFRA